MQEALKPILEIQEFDMQMIQLMRLKKERQKELDHIQVIQRDLEQKSRLKESEIIEHKKNIRLIEGEVQELKDKYKTLEDQQNLVKKVEEFNALSHEMSQIDRERNHKEQRLSDLYDRIAIEEDLLKEIQEKLSTTTESGKVLETEIVESVNRINEEGQALKEKRDQLVNKANSDIFAVYERLLKNKKDRVVVPIQDRCCSGCHIMLTAQDENLVRKGERITFCEHCSRILFWPEHVELEGTAAAPKPRRRRKV